jgi:hypothetical protein
MSKMNNRKPTHHFDGYVVHGVLVSGFMYQLGEDKFFSSADTLENSDIDPIDSVDHLEVEMFIEDKWNASKMGLEWKVTGYPRYGYIPKGSNPIRLAKQVAKLAGTTVIIQVGICGIASVSPDGAVSNLQTMSDYYLDVDPKLDEFSDMTRYM